MSRPAAAKRKLTADGARALAKRYGDRVASWYSEGREGYWFNLRSGWNHEGCSAVHVGCSGDPPPTYGEADEALARVERGEPY